MFNEIASRKKAMHFLLILKTYSVLNENQQVSFFNNLTIFINEFSSQRSIAIIKVIIFLQKFKGYPGTFQKRLQIILSQHLNVENAFWDGHDYKSHKRNRENTKNRIENAKKTRKHGSEFWLMNRWMFSSSIIGPDAWCVGFEQQALLAQ